ncbi:MAG: SAM-dependent methyltransferase [Acidimicrobiales bacterium]
MTVALERFDTYVERCLYHPSAGFYARGRGAGRRRDFITSPEVGPLYAAVLGRAVDGWWAALGQPEELTVYDVGSGPGTLADALARHRGPAAAAIRVVAVDPAPDGPRPGGSGPAGSAADARRNAERVPALPDDLTGAVVVANELLDNLPFRIVRRDGDGWAELYVAEADDRPRPVWTAAGAEDPDPLGALGVPSGQVPEGRAVPLLDAARTWVAATVERGAAVVLVVDYGADTTAELGVRGGWLRTYRDHRRGHDPFVPPGSCDITTDLAVDQLPVPTRTATQAEALQRWGIDELVAEGRRVWAARAARPDLEAMAMRSRVAEAGALLDPEGLGGWLVLEWLSDDRIRAADAPIGCP